VGRFNGRLFGCDPNGGGSTPPPHPKNKVGTPMVASGLENRGSKRVEGSIPSPTAKERRQNDLFSNSI
jgi:hypothetical protein